MALAVALHILAATVWVGGMFFAYVALRPAAAILDGPVRLRLFEGSFARFFRWVWGAVAVLLLSGYWMIFAVFGGMAGVGLHVHLMHGLGLVMMALFAHLYFAPYRRLRRQLAADQFAEAARSMNTIRLIVAINLSLGLVVVAVAAGGRYWSV